MAYGHLAKAEGDVQVDDKIGGTEAFVVASSKEATMNGPAYLLDREPAIATDEETRGFEASVEHWRDEFAKARAAIWAASFGPILPPSGTCDDDANAEKNPS